MKITYQFVTGEVVEIEVTEELGEVMVDIDREIYNNNQRESRRHCSLHKLEEAGFQVADAKSEVAAAVEEMERDENLHKVINKLLPEQKDLVRKVFNEEKSLTEIAKEEGVHKSAISHRLATIYKRLRKNLTKF